MAPPGLIISKLGVQATASSDTVRGLLCLKVSSDSFPYSLYRCDRVSKALQSVVKLILEPRYHYPEKEKVGRPPDGDCSAVSPPPHFACHLG